MTDFWDNHLFVIDVAGGIQTERELLIKFTDALLKCVPPANWQPEEWVDHISREYGLAGEASESPTRYHLRYIAQYLTNPDYGRHVTTIVVERKYLSTTFMSDYKNFYANVAGQYGNQCSRIHFFSSHFTKATFIDLVSQRVDFADKFDLDTYLGCFVVRPLHNHIVGTTLLRPYPEDVVEKGVAAKRHFPTVRRYVVSLFGWQLPIQTLAFTSQDKTVGACASFALWMAFDKTHKLFGTPLFTPSEITRHAGKSRNARYRPFPNRGLDAHQVGTVIEATGLEPEFRATSFSREKFSYRLWVDENRQHLVAQPTDRSVIDVDLVKAYIYAYCQLGVPVLLGLTFEEGKHLVTVSGYRERSQPDSHLNTFRAMLGERLLFKSRRIDRLFCHDDNIGAFSRLFFCEEPADLRDIGKVKQAAYGTLVSSWPSPHKQEDQHNVHDKVQVSKMRRRAELDFICVPIDGVVRLSFENIYEKVSYIDKVFDIITKEFLTSVVPDNEVGERQKTLLTDLCHMEWDIYLTETKTYKNAILMSTEPIHQDALAPTLVAILPRYVWVARGRLYQQGTWHTYAELVFDSTESPVAYPCKLFTLATGAYQALGYFLLTLTEKVVTTTQDEQERQSAHTPARTTPTPDPYKLISDFLEFRIFREQLLRIMDRGMIGSRFTEPIYNAFQKK